MPKPWLILKYIEANIQLIFTLIVQFWYKNENEWFIYSLNQECKLRVTFLHDIVKKRDECNR